MIVKYLLPLQFQLSSKEDVYLNLGSIRKRIAWLTKEQKLVGRFGEAIASSAKKELVACIAEADAMRSEGKLYP